jgi:hypothetical protein
LAVLAAGGVAAALFLSESVSETSTMPTPVPPKIDVSRPEPPPPAPPPDEAARLEEVEPEPREEAEIPPAPVPAEEEAAIRDLLDRWAATIRARNAYAQAELYAPTVDVFYGARNVTQDWVRRRRLEELQSAIRVRRFDFSNVHTELPAANRAVVTFDKSWDFAGRKRRQGLARSQLVLLKVDGRWRISSERDVRLLRGES